MEAKTVTTMPISRSSRKKIVLGSTQRNVLRRDKPPDTEDFLMGFLPEDFFVAIPIL